MLLQSICRPIPGLQQLSSFKSFQVSYCLCMYNFCYYIANKFENNLISKYYSSRLGPYSQLGLRFNLDLDRKIFP